MAQKKLVLIRCQQCSKNPATVLHPCPNKKPTRGDENLCNCCQSCKEKCDGCKK